MLYRARENGKSRLRDQLIPRKTSWVWTSSVDNDVVNKEESVGGSRGLYKVPGSTEESNFDQVVSGKD